MKKQYTRVMLTLNYFNYDPIFMSAIDKYDRNIDNLGSDPF